MYRLLINITGGEDLTLFEVDEIVNKIRSEVDSEAEIINGSIIDNALEGKIRVSIVATALDGQLPDSKSVINMVHRIQNRNPGYSDFQNATSNQNNNFSNIFSSPISDGATALKLENEVTQETVLDSEQSMVSNEDSNEKIEIQTETQNQNIENDIEIHEEEKVSNGLENFELDSSGPELFNSENENNFEEEFSSFTKDESLEEEEEDELDIPAFLRRQKN